MVVAGLSSHVWANDPEALYITGIVRSTNGISITWTNVNPGYAYTVEWTPELGNAPWQPAPFADTWPITTAAWTDQRPEGAAGFYRVKAEAVQPIDRGKLLFATRLEHLETNMIAQQFESNGIPVFPQLPVDVYKLDYETIDPFGLPILASGAVVLPSTVAPVPLVSYQHGTIVEKSDVPSQLSSDSLIGVAFGTSGYLASLPDYLGLGDSPGLHPYHHAATEAEAVVDLLRAARTFAASRSVMLNGQLFLLGYSQGGHATMAATRELETQLTNEFTVTASSPMAGAYDLSGVTTDDLLSDRPEPNPYYFIYLLAAYQEIYHLADSLREILAPPYDAALPPLLDGRHSADAINAAMPPVPTQVLRPEYLADFVANPDHPLRLALRANDLYDWTPTEPMRLYHCLGDQDVVFANSQVAYDSFVSRGATQVRLIDPFPAGSHTECAVFSLLQTKVWFDQLKH